VLLCALLTRGVTLAETYQEGGMKTPAYIMAALLAGSCVGKATSGTSPGAPGAGKPGGSGAVDPGPAPPPPWEALPPAVYASKVKDLLTGLPLSDQELAAAGGDLRPLIDGWMMTPQFREKMFEFFQSSFQQVQLDISDLDDQLRLDSADVNRTDQRRLLQSVQESFARTVMALVDEGRPFTETVTTNRFMLNLPMMVALSYMDAAPRDDQGRAVNAGYWLVNKYGGAKTFAFTQTTGVDPTTGLGTPIPLEQSIDPTSPNFLHFNFSQPDPMRYMPCADPLVVTGTRALERVFGALWGSRDACQGAPAVPTLFTDADWNTWRMVTIRRPRDATEERTVFWNVPRLRDPATTELVLGMPRVGFMTTLAFFANWPTNPSNAYRVTTNQALIVGLGRSFDDRTTTIQVAESNVDAQHVQPGTACFGCHQILDPMRDFFKQSYSITYFQQLGATARKTTVPPMATFNVEGAAAVSGNGVEVFAQALANHPLFPVAWTQKLCQLANASTCDATDPELQRVAGLFRDSKFDFKTLVRELYSSPLVTFASKTRNAEQTGVVISIARREALCARLSDRLGLVDACNLKGTSTLSRQAATQAKNLSLGIPGSSYARADAEPVMPHDPNLFFASATEKLCGLIAAQLIESGTNARWRVADRESALVDFVSLVMGVPTTDERAPLLRDVLARHYQAAVDAREKAADALRSTFVLACSSPSAVSAGL
jgi:hypothetical protein